MAKRPVQPKIQAPAALSYLPLLGLALAWSQFQLWRFYQVPGFNTDKASDSLVLMLMVGASALLLTALMALRGGLAKLDWIDGLGLGLGVFFFTAGAWKSGLQFSKVSSLGVFAVGCAALCLPLLRGKAEEAPPPSLSALAGALALALLAVPLIVKGDAVFWRLFHDPTESGNVLWMFPKRATSSSEPIPGGEFRNWSLLAAPALCLAAALAALAFMNKAFAARPKPILWVLALFSFWGKLAVESLSPMGIKLIWLKASTIHSSYLHVTLAKMKEMGAWRFLTEFNTFQGSLPVHAGTHGPLPELFYWPLALISGGSPVLPAVVYMALVSLAVFPLFWITRALTRSQGLGLAAAALWVFSPQNLIMGNAGWDAMNMVLLACCFWQFLRALEEESLRRALYAGGLFWVIQLGSMALLVTPVFFGLFALAYCVRRYGWSGEALRRTLVPYAIWLLLPLAGHLLLLAVTAGKFNYYSSCKLNLAKYLHDETFFHKSRPNYYWAWGNLMVFSAYASLPLIAAWLVQLSRQLAGAFRAQPFTPLGAAMVLSLVFSTISIKEIHRDYIWATFFILPSAAMLFAAPAGARKEPARAFAGVRLWALLIAMALIMANAVAMEIIVFDQN